MKLELNSGRPQLADDEGSAGEEVVADFLLEPVRRAAGRGVQPVM